MVIFPQFGSYISGNTDRILMTILSWIYLSTRKYALNFVSYQDVESWL